MTDKGREQFYIELRQWNDFKYLSGMELQTNWWSYFTNTDDDIMIAAIRKWKLREEKAPTVANIEEIVKVLEHEKARSEYRPINTDPRQTSVSCPICNDHGFLIIKYPTLVEAVRPCSCRASERYEGLKVTRKPEMDNHTANYLFGLESDDDGPSALQKLNKMKLVETVKNPMKNAERDKCGPGVVVINVEVKK